MKCTLSQGYFKETRHHLKDDFCTTQGSSFLDFIDTYSYFKVSRGLK